MDADYVKFDSLGTARIGPFPYCPTCGKCPACGRPQFDFGILTTGQQCMPLYGSRVAPLTVGVGPDVHLEEHEPFHGAQSNDADLLAGP